LPRVGPLKKSWKLLLFVLVLLLMLLLMLLMLLLLLLLLLLLMLLMLLPNEKNKLSLLKNTWRPSAEISIHMVTNGTINPVHAR
jgi:hypothetical protein